MRPCVHLILVSMVWVVAPVAVHGQLFITMNDSLGITDAQPQMSWGSGLVVYDLDEDGWDDFLVCRKDQSLLFFHNLGGTFERIELIANTFDMRAACLGDMDNDGDPDLCCTYQDRAPMLFRNNGNLEFEEITEEAGLTGLYPGRQYGLSWGDFDSDGFLDLYFCFWNLSDDRLFRNLGDGTFEDATFRLSDDEPINLSLACSFLDVDRDGDLDISVAVDRDPFDLLYLNDGANNFADVGPEVGFDVDLCAMTESWADYDHDGDFDKYVTNEPVGGNMLFQNDGQLSFVDVAPQLGLQVWQSCWGSVWIDTSNDTWEDLYVCTDMIMGNNHNRFFSNVGGEFQPDFSYSDNIVGLRSHAAAKGDFNRDGYYDLIASSMVAQPVQIYYNSGGANNYFILDLEGTVSNRDGFGAIITYYAGDELILQHTKSGEGYLAQNSQHLIMPLGPHLQADSLVITWPSGMIDTYGIVPAGVRLNALEGHPAMIALGPDQAFCENDSLLLSVAEHPNVTWNATTAGNEIQVTSAGTHSAWSVDDAGVIIYSDTLNVVQLALPQPDFTVSGPICTGDSTGSIALAGSDDIASMLWTNPVSNAAVIENLSAGSYTYQVTGANGCPLSGSVEIADPLPIAIQFATLGVSCHGGNDGALQLQSLTGGTGQLNWAVYQGSELQSNTDGLAAGMYTISVTDSLNCQIETSFSIAEPEELVATVASVDVSCYGESTGQLVLSGISGGTPPYLSALNAEEAVITNGEMVYDTLAAGNYTLSISDLNGCMAVLHPVVDSQPELSGVLYLTDEGWECVPIGGTPPYSYQWSNGSTGALSGSMIAGIHTIEVTDALGCIWSETLDIINSAESSAGTDIQCIVTTEGTIFWNCLDNHAAIRAFDLTGRSIPFSAQMTVTGLSRGVYFVMRETGTGVNVIKVFVP